MARALAAGLAYVALVFAAGFALGTLRTLLVAPRVGETIAVILELPVMLALCWLAAGAVIARLALAPTLPARLTMGGVAFALLMGAELGVSILAFGRDLSGHLAHYATGPGALGLAGQLVFAAIPALRR
ncbi:hypothetical protein [Rhodovulum marinum]|uniref:Uncharacterized protein n=1 Tax=Rhodovulum marinum TaxID=320662 RepID=A0A4R2Q5M6_9RHOB|nr:hypothetical protein [Rhodovulum marinum]TCP43118.1 hypothetical protein EV662_102311 [Rhodovulum marinum]